MIFSSGTSISIANSIFSPSFASASSNAFACGIVLGNPSKIYPFSQSSLWIRSTTRSHTSSSGTNSPLSMYSCAFFPSSVPSLIFALKISPVEMCGISYACAICFAWVPFPAPGAPNIIIFMTNPPFVSLLFLVTIQFVSIPSFLMPLGFCAYIKTFHISTKSCSCHYSFSYSYSLKKPE